MMNSNDRGYRQANATGNVVFQEPVEPVICWLDGDWPTRKQMQQTRRPYVSLLILIGAVMAGGVAFAAWNKHRSAEALHRQFIPMNTDPQTTRARSLPAFHTLRVSRIITQPRAGSDESGAVARTSRCGRTSAQPCPEDTLFKPAVCRIGEFCSTVSAATGHFHLPRALVVLSMRSNLNARSEAVLAVSLGCDVVGATDGTSNLREAAQPIGWLI